tara:strand:+ start:2445 stop:2738 length:294 start_codon:yes stop_codon:yes gene_type:complete
MFKVEQTVKRIRVRNCIRKDTYRYYIPQSKYKDMMKSIEDSFGEIKKLGDFDLYQIDHGQVLMRFFPQECTLTLIKKNTFVVSTEEKIHSLIGFNNV